MSVDGLPANEQNEIQNGSWKIVKQHSAKLLNLGLLMYLAFGGFAFNYLNELEARQEASLAINEVSSASSNSIKKTSNLNELRLESVRRMWNITNRLNILYEANWTSLVLDELIEFERQLIESLERKASGEEYELNELDEVDEKEKKKDDSKRRKSSDAASAEKIGSTNKRTRSESIKKSFIHSLATITTIDSPDGPPKSKEAKLFTVLYGAVGIPLMFCTISITGLRLTRIALNVLRMFSHFCITLPAYYLCCVCDLQSMIRVIFRCCCCCCCTLFCFPINLKKCGERAKRAPKFRLVKDHQLASLGGALGAARKSQSNAAATPFVINTSTNDNSCDVTERLTKTVRFGDSPKKQRKTSSLQDTNSNEGFEFSDSPYTFGLFLTSILLLSLYLGVGAIVYSRVYKTTSVDALYNCFTMLSGSKLPESFSTSNPKKLDIIEVYKTVTEPIPQKDNKDTPSDGIDPFFWDCIYLFCGLNLISMCTHFARLWANRETSRELVECIRKLVQDKPQNLTPPLMDDGENPMPLENIQQYSSIEGSTSHSLPSDQMNQTAGFVESQQQQLQKSSNMAELYVVNPQHHLYGHQQQHINQPSSDLSFSSDRSAMDAMQPLCAHHRVAHNQPTMSADSATLAAFYAAGTGSGTIHPSQKYLYLTTGCDENPDISDDQELAQRKQENLSPDNVRNINNKIRTSLSSLQLTPMDQVGDNVRHLDRPKMSQTLNRSSFVCNRDQVNLVTPVSIYGANGDIGGTMRNGIRNCEPDNSLNTNTDTNSNTISSRNGLPLNGYTISTVKHNHHPNGIGFMLSRGGHE